MICFKDMSFCIRYPKECKNHECPRALTEELRKEALEWWGTVDVPIAYMDFPNCLHMVKVDEEVEKN